MKQQLLMVQEKQLLYNENLLNNELVGPIDNLIARLESYQKYGWESIEVILEKSTHSPLQFNRSYWLVKTRLENDKEYEDRMRLEMKQQEKERIKKEKRRADYEKLKKEFEGD